MSTWFNQSIMSIKLYNSMSRDLEEFSPQNPENITMYVCGPTVYDTPHLGNARPAVVFDVLFRLLRHTYGDNSVEYARNFTDIDDKIMERASENGEDIYSLTERTIADYRSIMTNLSVLTPTHEPRATQYMTSIKGAVAELLLFGHAYSVDGHVLFDINSYPSHGILSGHKQEDLDAGHRVAVADYKRSAGDFILWKPSSDDQPGWDLATVGRGRPGWHIECSAMIGDIFAYQTIDIHGGGADLRFPHHDCEISQYGACHNRSLANYWMHNAMVLVDGLKMAKSTGNFITVKDVLHTGMHGEAIRLALLSSHYRSPVDWTPTLASQACQTLAGWHLALESIEAAPQFNEHSTAIIDALGSDLNTPLAIARIHERIGNLATDPEGVAAGVRYAAGILGLNLVDHDRYFRGFPNRSDIQMIVDERSEARANRDFAESDRLRNILTDMGLLVEDSGNTTKWRRT